MDKPVPPTSPDIKQMHRYQLALDDWLEKVFTNGVQTPFMSASNINSIISQNAKEYSGRMVINQDNGKITYFNITPGATPTLVKGELS